MSPPGVEIVIAEDAVARLAARVNEPTLVVMDANTREAAGAEVVAALRSAEPLVFEQRRELVAGPQAVERVRTALGERRLAVAVGAGVITDIVRRASDLLDHDFVSVPTAASMDGYASGVAALEIDGAKVTVPARPPRAIFADPRVVAAAPAELTQAGVGDLLAKATARVDWLAAHLLYGEAFSDEVDRRMTQVLGSVVGGVGRVLARDPYAVAELLHGLIESGLAIATVGSSRPASGCEHHASHFWDLLAARGLRPHHPHGLQVGYATWFAMRLQRFAFGGGVLALRRPFPVADPLGAAARHWLGQPSPYIEQAVAEKRRFTAELSCWPAGPSEWEAVRACLAPALAEFAQVEPALVRAGIPAEPGFLDIDAETLAATFRFASRLRARYTVIDFLEGQGALEPALQAILPARARRDSGSASPPHPR